MIVLAIILVTGIYFIVAVLRNGIKENTNESVYIAEAKSRAEYTRGFMDGAYVQEVFRFEHPLTNKVPTLQLEVLIAKEAEMYSLTHKNVDKK
jgi:hypothetical protein